MQKDVHENAAGRVEVSPEELGDVLIAISVILNLFSGLIPAKSAAKKDPVVALRTE